MSKQDRNWHPNFINYMKLIANHPNYKGLPLQKKKDGSLGWIATAKTKIGKDRIAWCLEKAKELNIPNKPGVYAEVMLAIHPTKRKVCQTCGESMSLYYHYPNSNFLKALNKEFQIEFNECDNILSIWDNLIESGIDKTDLALFLITKGGLNLDPKVASKEEIINALEISCRKKGKKLLGPGAMSNFPDRFDGFHTYNRCCRANQDKGRSTDNLKTYSKDRRAYEYWSDGNIYAADKFMHSDFFKDCSADHIGPISLGFVHDPRYLQPMKLNDNSSKRDRLQIEDINKIIQIHKKTGIYPMSWYSKLVWEYIQDNYTHNKSLVASKYRDALKQSMTNFMHILGYIIQNCIFGKDFLKEALLRRQYKCFQYSYKFDKDGQIISKEQRKFTASSKMEFERYARIALDSVKDYNEKSNRKFDDTLTNEDFDKLSLLCKKIDNIDDFDNFENSKIKDCLKQLEDIVEKVEIRVINSL